MPGRSKERVAAGCPDGQEGATASGSTVAPRFVGQRILKHFLGANGGFNMKARSDCHRCWSKRAPLWGEVTPGEGIRPGFPAPEKGTTVVYEAMGREHHPHQESCTYGDTLVMEWSLRTHKSTPVRGPESVTLSHQSISQERNFLPLPSSPVSSPLPTP